MTSHSRIIMRNIFRCRERHNLSWSMLVSGGQEKVNKKLVEVLLCRTETVGLSSRKGGTGAQDSHLNFYTAPELWTKSYHSWSLYYLQTVCWWPHGRSVNRDCLIRATVLTDSVIIALTQLIRRRGRAGSVHVTVIRLATPVTCYSTKLSIWIPRQCYSVYTTLSHAAESLVSVSVTGQPRLHCQ